MTQRERATAVAPSPATSLRIGGCRVLSFFYGPVSAHGPSWPSTDRLWCNGGMTGSVPRCSPPTDGWQAVEVMAAGWGGSTCIPEAVSGRRAEEQLL